MYRVFFFATLILFVQSCGSRAESDKAGLEVFLTSVGTESNGEGSGVLEVEAEPLIEQTDIEYYDWQNHELALKDRAWDRIRSRVSLETVGTQGLPFIIIIDRERVFMGHFWSLLSPLKPTMAIVLVEDLDQGNFILRDASQVKGASIDDVAIRDYLDGQGLLRPRNRYQEGT